MSIFTESLQESIVSCNGWECEELGYSIDDPNSLCFLFSMEGKKGSDKTHQESQYSSDDELDLSSLISIDVDKVGATSSQEKQNKMSNGEGLESVYSVSEELFDLHLVLKKDKKVVYVYESFLLSQGKFAGGG